MLHTAKSTPGWPLILLAVLQAGCLAESAPGEVVGRCSPGDLTPECCLKQFPGQWERCTGSSEMTVVANHSLKMKAAAAGTAVTMAIAPQINSAERRGVELATDLLAKIETAIVECTRWADQAVNDYHFDGKSPRAEICEQIKVGQQTTSGLIQSPTREVIPPGPTGEVR